MKLYIVKPRNHLLPRGNSLWSQMIILTVNWRLENSCLPWNVSLLCLLTSILRLVCQYTTNVILLLPENNTANYIIKIINTKRYNCFLNVTVEFCMYHVHDNGYIAAEDCWRHGIKMFCRFLIICPSSCTSVDTSSSTIVESETTMKIMAPYPTAVALGLSSFAEIFFLILNGNKM